MTEKKTLTFINRLEEFQSANQFHMYSFLLLFLALTDQQWHQLFVMTIWNRMEIAIPIDCDVIAPSLIMVREKIGIQHH